MKYTIITCATSHLGQALIKHLAKEKYPMILLGRDAQKLNNIAESIIESGFDFIKTKVVDFACHDSLENFGKWISEQTLLSLARSCGLEIVTPCVACFASEEGRGIKSFGDV